MSHSDDTDSDTSEQKYSLSKKTMYLLCQRDEQSTDLKDAQFSYGVARLHKEIESLLQTTFKNVPPNEVTIFGGHIRRRISAKYHLNKALQTDVYSEMQMDGGNFFESAILSADCFVDAKSDMDIFFSSQTQIDTFVRALEKYGGISSVRVSESLDCTYRGLFLTRVAVHGPQQYFGCTAYLKLDLVIRNTTAPQKLWPDFEVNQLALRLDGTVNWFSSEYEDPVVGLMKLTSVVKDIQKKQTDITIVSDREFLSHFLDREKAQEEQNLLQEIFYKWTSRSSTTTRSVYIRYCINLFHRLHNLLKDGWTIKNLSQSCLCKILTFDRFQLNPTEIVVECSRCKQIYRLIKF
jgi:hypothetical protein